MRKCKQSNSQSLKTPGLRYAEEPGWDGPEPGSSVYLRTGVPTKSRWLRPFRVAPRTAGIILADAMVGIGILAVLAVIAATCAGWQRRAAREMADVRAATDLAEAVLINLHQGLPAAQTPADQIVKVAPINGGEKITGYSWVRVTAACHGHAVSLTGLSKG